MAMCSTWRCVHGACAVRSTYALWSKCSTFGVFLLIAKAAVEWKRAEGTYRDDITAVVVYLKDLLPIL